MGFLSSVARGALGPGLLQVAQMQQRQAELDAAMQDRAQQREEDRKFRLDLARENNTAREDLAALRAELRAETGGGGSTRSGSGSRKAGGGTSDEDAAVYQIMKETGASLPEARGMLDSARGGTNPYKRTVDRTETIDDGDRQRTVTTQGEEADVARYRQLNRLVAKALMEGPSNMAANPEQRAKGEQTRAETEAARRYGHGDVGAGREALALHGKGEFGTNGTSDLTGGAAANSVAASMIRENDAQAAKARRDGSGDPSDALKLPAGVKDEVANLNAREKEIASLIAKAKADGSWTPDKIPSQKELQADLVAVRLRRQKIIAPYVKGSGAGGADPLGLLGDDKPAPAKEQPKDEKPGMLATAGKAAAEAIKGARTEGSNYQAIYKRWREAGDGGAPLTPEEKAEARRFGLPVKG